MELYLVRHAIAEQRDSARWPDDSRGRSPRRGSSASGSLRAASGGWGSRSKPCSRARTCVPGKRPGSSTARPNGRSPEECRALEPTTPRTECLDALRNRQESTLALVGHQPLLSGLASLLLAGSERSLLLELKKGGVMCLRFDAPRRRREPPPCAGARAPGFSARSGADPPRRQLRPRARARAPRLPAARPGRPRGHNPADPRSPRGRGFRRGASRLVRR